MEHDFRGRLRRGERLIGTMVTLPSPEVTEVLASIGFDWLFLDAEHGVLGARDLQALLQAAGRAMPGVVRVAAAAEVPIKKALDIGAAGIIVPQVNSAAQVAQVIRLARYSPLGTRGVGIRLGIFGVSAAAIQPYLARGYTLLVAGVDTLLLGQAAQAILTELKA